MFLDSSPKLAIKNLWILHKHVIFSMNMNIYIYMYISHMYNYYNSTIIILLYICIYIIYIYTYRHIYIYTFSFAEIQPPWVAPKGNSPRRYLVLWSRLRCWRSFRRAPGFGEVRWANAWPLGPRGTKYHRKGKAIGKWWF